MSFESGGQEVRASTVVCEASFMSGSTLTEVVQQQLELATQSEKERCGKSEGSRQRAKIVSDDFDM